ncbi:MAG: hypothetical protein K8R87_01130 [Verrucomicrobia bacterium]|nr:hypothetical protein [Verrucomicrobiota bacterium]
MMDKKLFLYFAIAFLGVMTMPDVCPATYWLWFKLVGSSCLQGFIAVKALQSSPPSEPAPPPVDPPQP